MRSAVHFTGRPTLREPQTTSANSGKKLLRVPKLPPISWATTRTDSNGTLEDRRYLLLLPHDAAGAGVERVASGRRVVDADRGARLHRHAGDAIDPGVEPRDVGGARERRIGRFGVADLGVDHDVRQVVVEPRRVFFDRRRRVGHGRQRLVVDDHFSAASLACSDRLGDDEGDRGADVADAIGRQHVMRRHRHRRAVAVGQHDVGRRAGGGEMRNALEPVGQRVLAGQHREHAGHGARRGDVDRTDQRVGMRRAHRGAVGLAGQIDVVAVIAAAGDEARVFLAAYRLSDACVHDAIVRLAVAGRRYSHSETGAATTLFRSFLWRAHGCGAAGRRKFLAPMLRDIGAGAKPDTARNRACSREA